METYSIGIIGPGRVGKALLMALKHAGHRIQLVGGRNTDNLETLKAELPETLFTSNYTHWPPVDILFITVPDDAIEDVADRISRSKVNLRSVIVAHTSGAKSSDLLFNLREKGALVASIHPARSFAGLPDDYRKFRGSAFAIEGDPQAAAVLSRLFSSLGGIPFQIPTEAKPLYHLACVMVSNYSTALMGSGLSILEQIGIPRPKGRSEERRVGKECRSRWSPDH